MKLPKTILMYPMTLASQAAHIVMRFQQNVAELVIKGDATLENLFPPKDEQPEWATFDEDAIESADEASGGGGGDDERRTEGRFALYSLDDAAADAAFTSGEPASDDQEAGGSTVVAPAVVDELDYENLTLAQLRARLQSLDVDELEALLSFEEATKARAPFQTLLANRITRATAK